MCNDIAVLISADFIVIGQALADTPTQCLVHHIIVLCSYVSVKWEHIDLLLYMLLKLIGLIASVRFANVCVISVPVSRLPHMLSN